MTKYSNEFKGKAIKMVLKGNSISHLAKNPDAICYSIKDVKKYLTSLI